MCGHKALGPESGGDRIEALEDRSLGQTCDLATPEPQRLQDQHLIALIRVTVTPTENGRKWRAAFDGETICVASSPLVKAARTLLDKGFDPAATIEMWREGANGWALRGCIAAVAAVVLDGEKNPQRLARNGSPARSAEQGRPTSTHQQGTAS